MYCIGVKAQRVAVNAAAAASIKRCIAVRSAESGVHNELSAGSYRGLLLPGELASYNSDLMPQWMFMAVV